MKFKTKASKMRMRKNTEGNFVECSRDGESDTEECEGEGENSESIWSVVSGTKSGMSKNSSVGLIKTSMSRHRKSTFINKETVRTGKSRLSNATKLEELNPIEKLEFWENEPDLLEITRLKSGSSFGEIALIEDKPRGATIKWESDWMFATMERDDYSKTLSRIENRIINKIIDFFQDLPYFSSYGRTALNKIRFQFKKIK